MILINGVVTEHIAVGDRGFQYGDGLFETIEVSNGKPVYLTQHLNRLASGCTTLKITPPELPLLIDECNNLCQTAQQAVLKIIITRGSGGRGYRLPENSQATRVLSLHPFPTYPSDFAIQGITAKFCDTHLGINPSLAGIKHLNRLEQIMARAEWESPDIQEGIMSDSKGNVIEGTMTNLFYVKAAAVYTASVETTGVRGITRAIIMGLIQAHGLSLTEHSYTKATLLTADEIFVCNSVIGIWPIINVGGNHFPVGPLTRQLQRWLTLSKAQAIQ